MQKNFDIFEKICGAGCKSVVLGTTKWRKLSGYDLTMTQMREKQLLEIFWKAMIARGSKVERVVDSPSTWKLIHTILGNGASDVMKLQNELPKLPSLSDEAPAWRKRAEKHNTSSRQAGAQNSMVRVALAQENETLKQRTWYKVGFLLALAQQSDLTQFPSYKRNLLSCHWRVVSCRFWMPLSCQKMPPRLSCRPRW